MALLRKRPGLSGYGNRAAAVVLNRKNLKKGEKRIQGGAAAAKPRGKTLGKQSPQPP